MSELFIEGIIEDVIDRIEQRKGNTYCLSDLGFMLTEGENANGSWYCSTWEAKKEIADNFDLFSDFAEYYEDEFCEVPNIMKDAEKWHCIFYVMLYERLFNLALYKTEYCDIEKMEIDDKFISAISKELKELTFEDVF